MTWPGSWPRGAIARYNAVFDLFVEELKWLSLYPILIQHWLVELYIFGVMIVKEAPQEMHVYRLTWLTTIILLLAFTAIFNLADTPSTRTFWPEIALVISGLTILFSSYHSRFIQRHFLTCIGGLCYLTSFWFIARVTLSGFPLDYAVGLLFIIPGIGVGYGLNLTKTRPLNWYFLLSLLTASTAILTVPTPAIYPYVFITGMTGSTLITFKVIHCRLREYSNLIVNDKGFRAVVEQAADGIYLLDGKTLRYLYANPAFLGMVGFSLQELKQMTIYNLIVLNGNEYRNEKGSIYTGKNARMSIRRLRRKDGSAVCVELRTDRIRYGNREVLSTVAHDVSQRQQYEQRLIEAKNRAEEIARFKTTILSNMSHEFRTPLTTIIGFSELLHDEIPEEQRELLGYIADSGKRLHNTLCAVLELAYLNSNDSALQPTTINVVEEAGNVIGQFSRQARMKGIALILQKPVENIWAHVDPSYMHRILTQLVDNAIKFSDDGQVIVSIAAQNNDLLLAVKDSGIGISESFLPHIFKEFSQESDGFDRDHEGNGIGLSIAQRLIGLIGGEIRVESTRGVGSTFTAYFPEIIIQNQTTISETLVA